RTPALARPGDRAPFLDRRLLHALHRELEHRPPASRARPPARARDRLLLLRLQRARPARWDPDRLAGRNRRDRARVRSRRNGDRAGRPDGTAAIAAHAGRAGLQDLSAFKAAFLRSSYTRANEA